MSDAGGSLIGRMFGNYRIESLLGEGGMGQVYRARHTLLDRSVALKLMHTRMGDDAGFQARFRREARAAASLRHPHIVDVLDFAQAGEFDYMVMELVTGGTFRQLLIEGAARDQHWSLGRGLELIRQAADALAHAHRAGIVHRDIKPENLLLQPSPAGGTILKVSDFGLAHLMEGAGSQITQSGTTMGTLAYMAPEQASGQPIDGRADLYALGVVLYELATGQQPFSVRSVAEAVYKHVHVPPVPPRSVRPDLPPAVESLILHCLEKLPADRVASAEALERALRDLSGAAAGYEAASLFAMPAGASLVGTQLVAGSQLGLAPEVQSLVGASNQPRIQVLSERGDRLQVAALRPGELTVGRLPENMLRIDHPSISRNHLRVTWDGLQVQVTDLGSRAGTQLGGQVLAPEIPVTWPWGALLRAGALWLRLEAPTVGADGRPIERAASSSPALELSGAHRAAQIQSAGGAIGLVVEPEELALTPGQPATCEVTITNNTPEPDYVALSVGGVPPEWVRLPATQQLVAWGQVRVRVTVLVPEGAEARAGERSAEIVAAARANPQLRGAVLARWAVRPQERATLSLSPAQVALRGQASLRATLANEGNTPARYRLRVAGAEEALVASVEPAELLVEPGARAQAKVELSGRAGLLGGRQQRRIELEARAAEGATTLTAGAQVTLLPLLPLWAGVLALLLALAGAGALAASMLGGLGGTTQVAGGAALATVRAQRTAAAEQQRATETGVALLFGQTQTVVAELPEATRFAAQTAVAIERGAAETAVAEQSLATAQALPQPTDGATAQATSVAGAPTSTPPSAATATPTPPSAATATPSATASATPTGAPTSTPPGAVATPTATATATPTATTAPTATAAPTATTAATATPTATASPTSTPLPVVVTSLSPVTGDPAGGTSVTITGSGMLGSVSVTFGGVPATLVGCNPGGTSCTVTSPAGAGQVQVVVLAAGGASGPRTYSYGVQVSGISPVIGSAGGGTTVTLSGNGFKTGMNVQIGGVPAASVTCSSRTSCTAVTGGGGVAGAPVPVSVGVDGQIATLGNAYTYELVVSGLSQGAGSALGGQAITVSGFGFSTVPGATIVRFGSVSASSVSCSSTQACVVLTPAGQPTGSVALTVIVGSQTRAAPGGFNFQPALQSLSPGSGLLIGGTIVTVSGAGFINGATTFTFGGTAAVGVSCATTVTCTMLTPAHAPGTVDVVVVVAGQSAVLRDGYSFF